jgi:hypothetical protein
MEPGLRGGTSFDCFTPQAIHLSCEHLTVLFSFFE